MEEKKSFKVGDAVRMREPSTSVVGMSRGKVVDMSSPKVIVEWEQQSDGSIPIGEHYPTSLVHLEPAVMKDEREEKKEKGKGLYAMYRDFVLEQMVDKVKKRTESTPNKTAEEKRGTKDHDDEEEEDIDGLEVKISPEIKEKADGLHSILRDFILERIKNHDEDKYNEKKGVECCKCGEDDAYQIQLSYQEQEDKIKKTCITCGHKWLTEPWDQKNHN